MGGREKSKKYSCKGKLAKELGRKMRKRILIHAAQKFSTPTLTFLNATLTDTS